MGPPWPQAGCPQARCPWGVRRTHLCAGLFSTGFRRALHPAGRSSGPSWGLAPGPGWERGLCWERLPLPLLPPPHLRAPPQPAWLLGRGAELGTGLPPVLCAWGVPARFCCQTGRVSPRDPARVWGDRLQASSAPGSVAFGPGAQPRMSGKNALGPAFSDPPSDPTGALGGSPGAQKKPGPQSCSKASATLALEHEARAVQGPRGLQRTGPPWPVRGSDEGHRPWVHPPREGYPAGRRHHGVAGQVGWDSR